MNTMTTLFGGLAAVLLLYAIGGVFRGLPPVLRAALAGVIPLIVYFGLITGNWPGLDVVAIHVSVFLAAALVLMMMSHFRKRGSGRMHWAPRLLTGFFISLVFVNAALLYISTQGLPAPLARWWLGGSGGAVYSGFSGVVAHDQSAAKAVSSELKETHRESQLGWQVELTGLDGTHVNREIRVRVKDRTGLPVDRVAAELRLLRPGSAAPIRTVSLAASGAGVYDAALTLPVKGRWLIDVRLMKGGELHFHSIQEVLAS